MMDLTTFVLTWLALCSAGGGLCFFLVGRAAYALGADGSRLFTWSEPFSDQDQS